MLLTGAVVALNCVFLLLYLTTPSSFPRPLSPEEEARCLTLARQGDADARARLIEHNLRLVAHIVKKYYTSGEQDDLISIGTIGLIKAVDSFDAGKGIRLATYAARCIENATLSQRTFCPLLWRIAHPRRKKRPVFCRRANLAAAMPRHALNQLPFAPLDFAGRHGAGRKSSDITKGWGSHPIPLPMYPPDGLNQLRLLLHGAGHGLDVLHHRLRMDGGNLFGKRRLHFRACGIMHDNAQRTSPLPGKAVYASALVPHALFGQGGTPPLHALSQQATLTVAAGPVSPKGRGVTGPRRNVSFPYIILLDIILLACNSSCSLPWRSCCQAVRLPEIFALRKGRPPAVPCVRCSCVQDGNAPCHRPGRGICGAGIGAEATGRERPCRRSRLGPAEILPCSLRTSLWQLGRACAIMCYNIRKSIPEAMGGGDRVATRTENRFGLFPGAVVFGGAFCHLYV